MTNWGRRGMEGAQGQHLVFQPADSRIQSQRSGGSGQRKGVFHGLKFEDRGFRAIDRKCLPEANAFQGAKLQS